MGHTDEQDRQTGKTCNVAYLDGRIIKWTQVIYANSQVSQYSWQCFNTIFRH